MTGGLFRATLLLAAALVFAGVAGGGHAAQPLTFKVGLTAPTVNMLPLWMGLDAGLFKARGLDVEIVNTDGASRGLTDVGAGKLQAMTVGLASVIEANGGSGDYRLIASGANTMNFGFIGAKGVTEARALKGKRVGVIALRSESDSAASIALKQLGLTRGDVTFVEVGGTLKRFEALKSGAIAAAALNEPTDGEAQQDGLPLLVDLKSQPWIFTGIVMDRRYLGAHREQVKDFLRAYVEGIYLALSDAARAKRVIATEFKIVSPAIVETAYQGFKARVPRDAAPSGEGAEIMLRELPGPGAPVKSANTADYVDASLIEELRAEGFIDAMKNKYRVN